MVKHIILWKLKPMSPEEKKQRMAEVKAGLEGLAGQIPGLMDIQVRIQGLASSTADMMLDSTFADEEALHIYAAHPAHQQVANTRIRPFVETRLCLDLEAEA